MAIVFVSINSWLGYYKKKKKRNKNFIFCKIGEKMSEWNTGLIDHNTHDGLGAGRF